MKIVEKWWRNWSVWLTACALFVAELAVYLPEVQQALPAEWYRAAFVAILVARIIKQQAKP